VVIAGCGFLGEAAAFLFAKRGHSVLGLCATQTTSVKLADRPFEILKADISGSLSEIPAVWKQPDLLIHCASTGGGSADDYRNLYRDGLANLLEFFAPRRVLFTGSTSVYAQTTGEWVDEESPTQPARETSRILLEAESLALGAGGVVARLAGLYGPGRSTYLKKFLDGRAALEAGGTRWINQIHRDDAARALIHLSNPKVPSGIYNVCDNTPVTQRGVYEWIADCLKKPLPPTGSAEPARKKAWTNKRVRNARLRGTGWKPAFASYREGLPSLL